MVTVYDNIQYYALIDHSESQLVLDDLSCLSCWFLIVILARFSLLLRRHLLHHHGQRLLLS